MPSQAATVNFRWKKIAEKFAKDFGRDSGSKPNASRQHRIPQSRSGAVRWSWLASHPSMGNCPMAKCCHNQVGYMGLSENVVYPYTQWFCWSLSLLNGYFIGGIPHFQTYPYETFMDWWPSPKIWSWQRNVEKDKLRQRMTEKFVRDEVLERDDREISVKKINMWRRRVDREISVIKIPLIKTSG